MDKDFFKKLLEGVQDGSINLDKALGELKYFPLQNLSGSSLDTQRSLRRGQVEVVYGEGKTNAHLTEIVLALLERQDKILITRSNKNQFNHLKKKIPFKKFNLVFNDTAKFIHSPFSFSGGQGKNKNSATVLIVSAGSSDERVVTETLLSSYFFDLKVEVMRDVGVAGIQRLFTQLDIIKRARVIIVIAGMDGALASVVGGIVAVPVIAVPTSVGYGASFSGMAPLLAMLNSCADGVAVVNIDNGYGAAAIAYRILSHYER